MMTDHNSNNIQLTVESAKSQDFFQDNNQLEKKYTTKRIKSRSFLSNIAYVDISKGNFYKIFSLDRKLADKKHEMIYMLWKDSMRQKFYQHICKEKKFLYLNGKNVL